MPPILVAGETLSQTISLPAYSAAAGWVLTLYLNPRTGRTNVSVTSTASGADHLLQASATTTAGWAAGHYAWEIWAALGDARKRIDGGLLEVRVGLISAAAGLDTRSSAVKALAAAELALETFGATAYLQTVRIGDREQRFHSPGDFLSFISRLRAEVQREANVDRLRQGLRPRNQLLVRLR